MPPLPNIDQTGTTRVAGRLHLTTRPVAWGPYQRDTGLQQGTGRQRNREASKTYQLSAKTTGTSPGDPRQSILARWPSPDTAPAGAKNHLSGIWLGASNRMEIIIPTATHTASGKRSTSFDAGGLQGVAPNRSLCSSSIIWIRHIDK